MYKLFILSITIILFTGCGGSSRTQNTQLEENIALNQNAKNYFGILADAEINIYELDGKEKKLLFKEKTTSGQTIEKIGNFDPHLRHMDRNKYYLYEVRGGENWDQNKDGILDDAAIENKTVFRTVYKGYRTKVKWWHTKNDSNTIALSEK